MAAVGVMHVVDSLAAAGRERVAVNLVNCLPRDRYVPYLCTTRYDGPLANLVSEDVGRLRLARAFRYDLRAVLHLIGFVRRHDIRILHAHDAAIFLAWIASLFPPYPAVVWHDHFGSYAFEERPVWLYRSAVAHAAAVITVNEPLAEWSRSRLGIPAERVRYIPNFVCLAASNGNLPFLPGTPGKRIVCLANLRAQKDHLTLLRALAIVIRQFPAAHLLLVGGSSEPEYKKRVEKEISLQGLGSHVSLLGERSDSAAVLKACDIGVLSSASEGLPLALLEYGLAGLPVVATRVGQCAEVLYDGSAGVLVEAGSPAQLAAALMALLQSQEKRVELGAMLQNRVSRQYSAQAVIEHICSVYEKVLGRQQANRDE